MVHNPIDVDAMAAAAGRQLQGPLPQADRPVRILVPGLIIRTKGQHTAVEAMRPILDAGHDAVLWLAGDVPQATAGQRRYPQQIRDLTDRLGVADRVCWLGARGDIPQLMAAATIVAVPTHTEGHPRIVLEAMSLAKPLAATPAGGIADMILPGVTGLYFDPDDAAGLARCVDRFASDPAAAERMGRQGRQYVRESFTLAGQTEKLMGILRTAIEHRVDS